MLNWIVIDEVKSIRTAPLMKEEKTMITSAIQVTIFVRDLDEAKAYYTEKLGFHVVAIPTKIIRI